MSLSNRLHRVERSLPCPACGGIGSAAIVIDETEDGVAGGTTLDDVRQCPTCGRQPQVIRIVDEDVDFYKLKGRDHVG